MKRSERRKRYEQKEEIAPVKKTSQETPSEKKSIKTIYYTHYKKLLIIPMLMLLIALIVIGIKVATTGEFINKGISLKGGTSITAIGENINSEELQKTLIQAHPDAQINVRTLENSGKQIGVLIESDILPENTNQSEQFIENIKKITSLSSDDLSIETIGQTLGDAFFKQAIIAIFVAFIFMGIVVFLYFRTIIPSAAIILAAFSNIAVTVAVLNIFDVKIGTAGIAALLMLIGYSIDTDVVLNTRVLKRKEGTVYSRIIGAIKTGLIMNITTLSAVIVALILAESTVLKEIMLILLIGLFADMINTWIQNAGILRWYMETKKEM